MCMLCVRCLQKIQVTSCWCFSVGCRERCKKESVRLLHCADCWLDALFTRVCVCVALFLLSVDCGGNCGRSSAGSYRACWDAYLPLLSLWLLDSNNKQRRLELCPRAQIRTTVSSQNLGVWSSNIWLYQPFMCENICNKYKLSFMVCA